MAARRLERPLDPTAPVGRPVRFRWDGRTLEGREGEPLAVALLAAGYPTLSRSFRFHRPRGLVCATGACGWCECRVDGLPSQRSCRVALRDGLEARGEHAWPSVATDLFGLLDLGNRLVTPGFYHHRFLRPHALRKPYLDVIRAFGGRGRIDPGPRERRVGTVRATTVDVAVVGAGRAGLTAALAAARNGARVAVLEAEDIPGGHAAWSFDPAEREVVRDLVAAAAATPGLVLECGATVLAREDDRLVAHVPGGLLEVTSPAVVAATGSYERPPLVPGGDRPGVIAARTVEWLAVRWGVVAGRRAVLVGEGPEADRAARLLETIGVAVAGRAGQRDLRSIRGGARVTGCRLAEHPGGAARAVAADIVVFTDRVPNLDLALLAGVPVEPAGTGLRPVIAASGQTPVPWLSIVGSAAGAHAGATSRLAGAAMDGAPDAMLCYCEDVRVRDVTREIAAGYDDPELLKRRTGALTGPCQGKLCLDRFLGACGRLDDGAAPGALELPTARPPLARVRLADLVVAGPAMDGDGPQA